MLLFALSLLYALASLLGFLRSRLSIALPRLCTLGSVVLIAIVPTLSLCLVAFIVEGAFAGGIVSSVIRRVAVVGLIRS